MRLILTILTVFSLQNAALAADEKDLSSVLLIGDSHSAGEYGKVLDSYFRGRSEKVSSFAICGSSPSTWTKDPSKLKSTNCGVWSKTNTKESRVKDQTPRSFKTELNSADPDVVVISMGTNILSSPAETDKELKIAEEMIKSVKEKKAQCIWAGPPDLRKPPFKTNLAAGIQKMKDLTSKYGCGFIDSSKVTTYPAKGSDGIHYAAGTSKKWGESVVEQLKTIVKTPTEAATAKPSSPAGIKASGNR